LDRGEYPNAAAAEIKVVLGPSGQASAHWHIGHSGKKRLAGWGHETIVDGVRMAFGSYS